MSYSIISWDWKSSPTKEQFESMFKELGVEVFIYEDPGCEGTDQVGFVFSTEPLSSNNLDEIANEGW